MPKFTKESIEKELKRIQESVPSCYREGLLTEVDSFPAMRETLEMGLNGDFPEEKKEQWRTILGTINEREVREDPKKAKLLDQWVSKKIKESIKAGRLPSKAQLKKLNIMYENKKAST